MSRLGALTRRAPALLLAALASTAVAFDGRSLFNLDASWKDQNGRAMSLASLAGAPTVLALIYSECSGICPMTVQHLRALQAALPEPARRRVHFVLVSLDPQHDDPGRLRRYATKQRLEGPNWVLLSGANPSVRALAQALGARYRALGNGQIAHDQGVFLVDAGGVVQKRVGDPAELGPLLPAELGEKGSKRQ